MSSRSAQEVAPTQGIQVAEGCKCLFQKRLSESQGYVGLEIVIVVSNGASDYELANLVEPLHAASYVCQFCAPRWQLVGLDSAQVTMASGAVLIMSTFLANVDWDFSVTADLDRVLILLGDFSRQTIAVVELITLLRRGLAHGMTIAAVGDAIRLLVEEKLLRRGLCAMPPNMLSLNAAHQNLQFREGCFIKEGSIITCSGGSVTFDFAAALVQTRIEKQHFEGILARSLRQHVLQESESRARSRSTRLGFRNSVVSKVIQEMEESLSTGMPIKYFNTRSKVSPRQIERLFRSYLNTSPTKYYLNMRLEHARPLFRTTKMTILEVAFATGFTNPSHFSKCFRLRYGLTPTQERRRRWADHLVTA